MEPLKLFTIKSLACEDNREEKLDSSSTTRTKFPLNDYGEKNLVIGEKFITIS